jgi:hypothetical protein
MRQRADELKREIESAVENLIKCRNNPALVDAINVRQQELDGITAQLLGAEPGSISSEVDGIRRFALSQLGTVRSLLTDDVQKARAVLARHVTTIRMVPERGAKKGYRAEGEWNLLGGYPEDKKCVRMVAGGGFEPPTFGL